MKHPLKLIILWLFALPVWGHPGIGIVEDSRGSVFYTDLKQVWKIDVTGRKSVVVRNVHTHELYIDDQDNLFGEHLWYDGENLNTWGHYVWKLSSQGQVTKIIPDTEGFREHYSFVRDHFGNMYWVDRATSCQTIIKKSRDKKETKYTKACFEKVSWLSATHDGYLYFMDKQNLKKSNPGGDVKTVGSIPSSGTMGIWDDEDGNIYTATYEDKSIRKFSKDGKVTVVAKTNWIWSPSGGMVARNGDLWILENSVTNTVRVERISQSGDRTLY